MLDLPRPQVSLQVWSYQISQKVKGSEPKNKAKASSNIQETFEKIRDSVIDGNEKMGAALSRGLEALFNAAPYPLVTDGSFFDQAFYSYVTEKYDECLPYSKYCLGYYDALQVPPPLNGGQAGNASLSRLLLLLIAVRDDKAGLVVKKIADEMEDGPEDAQKCASAPSNATELLCFKHFRGQLNEFASQRNLHILRAAIIDFLFEYKWTVVYPNDFIPYTLQRTAHIVDSLFTPVTDAFNQDLDSYVNDRLKIVEGSKNKSGLSAFGSVQVSAISGTKATVSGKVNNYFDITPPQSLNDILNTANQKNLASEQPENGS